MSAKEGNIINHPKQLEETPELSDLKRFLQYLWWLIDTVQHSDSKLTKEQRYENSLKAIFGDNYQKWTKPPTGYTYENMREIKLQANKTNNLAGAIKNFLKDRQEPITSSDRFEIIELEAQQEDELETQFKRIIKHIERNEFLYEGQDFERGYGSFPWTPHLEDT